MKKALSAALMAALALLPSQALAWKVVYDPTNYKANLETKIQMIQQVKNSAEALQNDIKMLQKLDPSNLEQCLYRVSSAISDMERIRRQTDAIGTEYSSLMSEWSDANPDYSAGEGLSAEQYARQTAKNRERWDKALLQALSITGIAGPVQMAETGQAVQTLLHASQNAAGATGALQAANQLTALMISEQQKMQALMADSMRSTTMYYQHVIDGERQSAKVNQDFLRDSGEYEGAKLQGTGNQLIQFRE